MARAESQKRYLRKTQVAERYQVSTRTLDRWAESGKLPKPVRIGVVPMWDLDELEAQERAAMRARDT